MTDCLFLHVLPSILANNTPLPSFVNAFVAIVVNSTMDILLLGLGYFFFVYRRMLGSANLDSLSPLGIITQPFIAHALLVILSGFFVDLIALSVQPSVGELWEYGYGSLSFGAIATFSLVSLLLLFIFNYCLSVIFLTVVNNRVSSIGGGIQLNTWKSSAWIALLIAVITNPAWFTIYFSMRFI